MKKFSMMLLVFLMTVTSAAEVDCHVSSGWYDNLVKLQCCKETNAAGELTGKVNCYDTETGKYDKVVSDGMSKH